MFPVRLQGSNNWELIYANRLQKLSSASFIDPINIASELTGRYLAVGTKSLSAKPTWFKAGYLSQYIDNVRLNDGFIFPGSTTVDLATRIIKLNQVQIVVLPNLTDSYSLFFQPVYWLTDLNVAVWQFTGTEVDELDLLTQISNNLGLSIYL